MKFRIRRGICWCSIRPRALSRPGRLWLGGRANGLGVCPGIGWAWLPHWFRRGNVVGQPQGISQLSCRRLQACRCEYREKLFDHSLPISVRGRITAATTSSKPVASPGGSPSWRIPDMAR